MEKKKTHKICAYLMAAVLALTSFTGCTKLEDGIYSDGTKMDTVPATDTAPSDASAVTQTPVQTQDTQTDQSTAVTEDTAETTDIDDVVEPVVTGTSYCLHRSSIVRIFSRVPTLLLAGRIEELLTSRRVPVSFAVFTRIS